MVVLCMTQHIDPCQGSESVASQSPRLRSRLASKWLVFLGLGELKAESVPGQAAILTETATTVILTPFSRLVSVGRPMLTVP